jgi:hypothetical protein
VIAEAALFVVLELTAQANGFDLQCLLAHFQNEGGVVTVKALCGAEYSPVRTCYVFASGSKQPAPRKMRSGGRIWYRASGASFWMKFEGMQKWIRFDVIRNHVHLSPDSREWPARPDSLALTVCAGVRTDSNANRSSK